MWILPRQLHTSVSALGTEALISDSSEQSQACARWLLVRSKPLPVQTWCLKWNRDSWTRHLSGRILRPSHTQSFVTAWTSSLGVTHASHSQLPESDSARTTPVTSGHTSQMELLPCDQGCVSLRTSKDISAWGCPTSSKTWQDWVIERRGAYSQRLKSGRLTNANESSSWPSPVASEVRQGFQDRTRGKKGSQESLTTVVIKSGPVVHTTDRAGGNRRGSLNPRWVETLMGLPVGWTMPSCASPVTIGQTS